MVDEYTNAVEPLSRTNTELDLGSIYGENGSGRNAHITKPRGKTTITLASVVDEVIIDDIEEDEEDGHANGNVAEAAAIGIERNSVQQRLATSPIEETSNKRDSTISHQGLVCCRYMLF